MMNMVEEHEWKDELSVHEFTEYVSNLSSFRLKSQPPEFSWWGWVFWSSESDEELFQYESENQNPIQKKVQLVIQGITKRYSEANYLVQFWAPEMVGGKSCLKTSNQPFALRSLYKGLCWYRKQCMEHQYFVDQGAKEEEIGPPGRVFRTGHPESTPDLRLYSSQQYSLQNHAAQYGLRNYVALPVFDLREDKCIGVLELVTLSEVEFLHWVLENVEEALKISEAQKLALSEINEMLELVIKFPQLCVALVWIPCSKCRNMSINLNCMEQALFINEEETDWVYHQFREASQFHRLQTGNGVAGRVLSSSKKSCFFQNLCDFSITEFPLAHYAQEAELTECFTICLQSSHSTENDLYLIELFFSHAGNTEVEYFWSLLQFLLLILKMKLKSFKLATGQQLGEELVVEVMGFNKWNEHTLVEINPSKLMYPLKFEVTRYGKEMEQQPPFRIQRSRNVVEREEIATEKPKRKRNTTSFHISYEVLEPHFGKRLEDVAQELGVSKYTLTRAFKDCGIDRWPSEKNPSLCERRNTETRVGDKPPLLIKNSEHTEVVIITAKIQ